jgi:uncharacterized protein (TIGR02246 family)
MVREVLDMTDDEQAIRTLVALWQSASAAGDLPTVLELMDEDVVFLVAGQPPMQGRAAFEKALRGLLATHHLDASGQIQEIRVAGDFAYCWNVLEVRVTARAGGSPVVRSGSALSILRKLPSGAWVVARDANLLAAAS